MVGLFLWLGNFLLRLWEEQGRVWLKFWGVVVLLFSLAYQGFVILGDLAITSVERLATIMTSGVSSVGGAPCGGGLAEILAITNTFFPLDEFLRMMAALLVGIWIPIGVYRLIKSWLPSIFGWNLGGNT